MFCTNCGSRLQNSDIFCGNCGAKVLITEEYLNIDNSNESFETHISQVVSSENQNLNGDNNIYNQQSTVENNNVANNTYEQQPMSRNNTTNNNYNTYSNNNKNYNNVNSSTSINTAFINETINSLKNLFINPFDFLNKLHNMSNAVTGTIALLSLILTLLTLNKLFDNLFFSYFLNSGQIIFSLVIYCLGLSSILYVCSITIANIRVSWITLLKLSIVISLISSIGYFVSLIFSPISAIFSITLLFLTLIIGVLMTYEGFLRITSTTIQNAKISLITSYCVISLLSYLCIYSNM